MKKNLWHLSKGEVSDVQVDDFISEMEEYIDKQAKERLGVDEKGYPPITTCIMNNIKYLNHAPFLIEHHCLIENNIERTERIFSIFLNMKENAELLETSLKIMRRKEHEKKDTQNG
ncbi:hypothetical protein LCGC14_2546240 [marine sediment metagenome]|uniref:Uncharacterized protein n=1 Tax=marine sediment metagenome TaxID=412755 RepID=A0A0F9D0P7_9ZZZZ